MKSTHLPKLLAGLCLVVPTAAMAWNDTGHMLVAAVAETRLNPIAAAEVSRLLKVNSTNRDDTFITASCWADDIRSQRAETATWHYTNYYFRVDGKPVKGRPLPTNVVWAIQQQKAILADRNKPDAVRADALRFLIHFVGDVHQPLHATARETTAHQAGDRGGNDFLLTPFALDPRSTRTVKNLHQLWDAGGGAFLSVERPLSPDVLKVIRGRAKQVIQGIPSSFKPFATPETWAKESFALAQTKVYVLPEKSLPKPGYLKTARAVSYRRVGEAGIRLAALLNQTLGNQKIGKEPPVTR